MFVIAGVTGHVGSVAAKELLAKKTRDNLRLTSL